MHSSRMTASRNADRLLRPSLDLRRSRPRSCQSPPMSPCSRATRTAAARLSTPTRSIQMADEHNRGSRTFRASAWAVRAVFTFPFRAVRECSKKFAWAPRRCLSAKERSSTEGDWSPAKLREGARNELRKQANAIRVHLRVHWAPRGDRLITRNATRSRGVTPQRFDCRTTGFGCRGSARRSEWCAG
jgi:hypothetical protein